MEISRVGAHSSDRLEEGGAATSGVGLAGELDELTTLFSFSAQRLRGGESRGEDFQVMVVDVQDIYDEFSAGAQRAE